LKEDTVADSTFHLYQLQKLDIGLANLEQQITTIKAKIIDRSDFLSASMELDQSIENLNKEQEESDITESKLSAKRIKLAQSESSLYSGKIQNPKELQDLQVEIASLKKAIAILEDSQIEHWENIELLTKIKNEKYNYSTKVKENGLISVQKMEAEITQLSGEQQRLLLEKNGVITQISPSFLSTYEKLLTIKKGIAVSEIVDECCGICGTTLTPSVCQLAKNHALIEFCSNCGRILYAG
jgi:predicted  nucleic acid-binding Zn-ribbon protein